MRMAISLVLAGLLVLLPVEQVLAQAVQQEAVSVKQTAPSDGAARLFRVPPLSENSALFLRTSSDQELLDTEFSDAGLVGDLPGWWSNLSGVKKVGVVLGGIVVAGGIFGALTAAGVDEDDPESFRSKNSVIEGAGYGALVAIPMVVIIWAYGKAR